MFVCQFASREEQMHLVFLLSDEVVRVTDPKKLSKLILFPSKKDAVAKAEETAIPGKKLAEVNIIEAAAAPGNEAAKDSVLEESGTREKEVAETRRREETAIPVKEAAEVIVIEKGATRGREVAVARAEEATSPGKEKVEASVTDETTTQGKKVVVARAEEAATLRKEAAVARAKEAATTGKAAAEATIREDTASIEKKVAVASVKLELHDSSQKIVSKEENAESANSNVSDSNYSAEHHNSAPTRLVEREINKKSLIETENRTPSILSSIINEEIIDKKDERASLKVDTQEILSIDSKERADSVSKMQERLVDDKTDSQENRFMVQTSKKSIGRVATMEKFLQYKTAHADEEEAHKRAGRQESDLKYTSNCNVTLAIPANTIRKSTNITFKSGEIEPIIEIKKELKNNERESTTVIREGLKYNETESPKTAKEVLETSEAKPTTARKEVLEDNKSKTTPAIEEAFKRNETHVKERMISIGKFVSYTKHVTQEAKSKEESNVTSNNNSLKEISATDYNKNNNSNNTIAKVNNTWTENIETTSKPFNEILRTFSQDDSDTSPGIKSPTNYLPVYAINRETNIATASSNNESNSKAQNLEKNKMLNFNFRFNPTASNQVNSSETSDTPQANLAEKHRRRSKSDSENRLLDTSITHRVSNPAITRNSINITAHSYSWSVTKLRAQFETKGEKIVNFEIPVQKAKTKDSVAKFRQEKHVDAPVRVRNDFSKRTTSTKRISLTFTEIEDLASIASIHPTLNQDQAEKSIPQSLAFKQTTDTNNKTYTTSLISSFNDTGHKNSSTPRHNRPYLDGSGDASSYSLYEPRGLAERRDRLPPNQDDSEVDEQIYSFKKACGDQVIFSS